MNFYKILNEKENHNGYQYKTGLNIDSKPFQPSGDCESGGIYYAREDILAFLNYGCYLRKVTIPADAKVYENPGSPKKWKADRIILEERVEITPKVIQALIDEGADIHVDNDYAFRYASFNGHTEVVKVLLANGADIHADNDYAFRNASRYGHTEVVKVLQDHIKSNTKKEV